mgnify:CR=1 FL=1
MTRLPFAAAVCMIASLSVVPSMAQQDETNGEDLPGLIQPVGYACVDSVAGDDAVVDVDDASGAWLVTADGSAGVAAVEDFVEIEARAPDRVVAEPVAVPRPFAQARGILQ